MREERSTDLIHPITLSCTCFADTSRFSLLMHFLFRSFNIGHATKFKSTPQPFHACVSFQ